MDKRLKDIKLRFDINLRSIASLFVRLSPINCSHTYHPLSSSSLNCFEVQDTEFEISTGGCDDGQSNCLSKFTKLLLNAAEGIWQHVEDSYPPEGATTDMWLS
jgi:hypothetical protein